MAAFSVKVLDRHNEKDRFVWNRFMATAPGATIFHTPAFLSYHQDKFNEQHIGLYKSDQLFGIMPMAVSEQNGKKMARSPYGASYGSMIFASMPNYSASKKITIALMEYFQSVGIKNVILTPPPRIYYPNSCDTFIFSLLEQGFSQVNADITSVVELTGDIENEVFTSRARSKISKARKAGLRIDENADINIFWTLMDKTFAKHGTNPTHTLDEFKYLQKVLPKNIWVDLAFAGNIPVAGVGYFKINNLVNMTFYICTDPDYRDLQGASFAINHGILNSAKAGFKYFDFGTSSVNMVAREQIFEFKEGFGALGCFRHTFAWEDQP